MQNPLAPTSTLLLLLLAACGEEAATGPMAVAAPAAGMAASRQVPMKGSYQGTGFFTQPPQGCPGFYTVFSGTGTKSHSRRYSLDHVTCTVPIDQTRSSFTGEFTKTTANGDLIIGTHQGFSRLVTPPGPSSPVGVFAIEGEITFTGGTGRFEGATGGQRMEGTQWTDFSQLPSLPSRMVLQFDGTISSVGSRH